MSFPDFQIDPPKLRLYLLNFEHQKGRHKADFLKRFGFTQADPDALGAAINAHAHAHWPGRERGNEFGIVRELDGEFIALDGRKPLVRTVWQMDPTGTIANFVTLKPVKPVKPGKLG